MDEEIVEVKDENLEKVQEGYVKIDTGMWVKETFTDKGKSLLGLLLNCMNLSQTSCWLYDRCRYYSVKSMEILTNLWYNAFGCVGFCNSTKIYSHQFSGYYK